MTGTVQTFSLLCCFALFLLLPRHVMAESIDSYRAPETAAAQVKQSAGDSAAGHVAPATPGKTHDIHDIYGPLPLPEPTPYLLYTCLALLAAAVAASLIVLYKVRKTGKKTVHTDPTERALANVQKARGSYDKSGDLGRYCDEISDILRTSVEQESGYRISSRTTRESLNELKKQDNAFPSADNSRLDLLHRCLSRCDMVKFARFTPEHAEVEQIGRLAASYLTGSSLDLNGDY